MPKVPRDFYARNAVDVAKDLVGKVLVRHSPVGVTSGRVVETEAYLGGEDPASHAFRGPTDRNRVMFGPAGYLYVYVSYGIHRCANVVTGDPSTAGAVLLRALEPLEGIEIMAKRRAGRPLTQLCSGPGKLCSALDIGLGDYGADLTSTGIYFVDDGFAVPDIRATPRIGISLATDLPYRFLLGSSPFVSADKLGTRSTPGVARNRQV